jgi:hypothetical protein
VRQSHNSYEVKRGEIWRSNSCKLWWQKHHSAFNIVSFHSLLQSMCRSVTMDTGSSRSTLLVQPR